jgi:hypothetical protein
VRIRAKLASFGMLMDDVNARVNLYIMFVRTLHVYERVQVVCTKNTHVHDTRCKDMQTLRLLCSIASVS